MPRTPKNEAAEELAVAICRFVSPVHDLRQDIDSSMVAAEVAQALEAYLDLWAASNQESKP